MVADNSLWDSQGAHVNKSSPKQDKQQWKGTREVKNG